ncbi:hypothetical protein [Sphingomonas sp.]|uniref:hypothetical protein n=1 Tax=Sphingomonas sp. TaxID=28214 RepID=UPI0025F1D826|nr:hypothetical protein [Sphingomonas sp.]MBV9528247.1 hypothetical protein [Sphingomonas sp.]
MALRVVQPFGGHAIGEDITDAAEIAKILDSDHASFVVRVADPAPAEQAPPVQPVTPAEPKE